MLRWLKRRLHDWTKEEESQLKQRGERSREIQFFDQGKIVSGHVLRVHGLRLLVRRGNSVELIGDNRAVDRIEFWSLWERLTPKQLRPTWEDGTKFEPPV